jgi:hypothetical protein
MYEIAGENGRFASKLGQKFAISRYAVMTIRSVGDATRRHF